MAGDPAPPSPLALAAADSAAPQAATLAAAEQLLRLAHGDPERHRATAESLAVRARGDGQEEILVVALHALAWIEHEAMSNHRALELLSQAVSLAEEHRLPDRVGDLLLSRIAVLHELGRLDGASADLARAAQLVPLDQAARLALQQAALVQASGGADAAQQYSRLVRAAGAPAEVRAKAANNLAHIRAAAGRHVEALQLLDLALELASEVGPVLVAYLTHTRAWLMVQQGRPTHGLAEFRRARSLFERHDVPLGEHLAEYSDALAQLRLLPEAIGAAREATALLNDELPLAATEARLRLAWLQHSTGDEAAAHATAVTARRHFVEQGRSVWATRAAFAVTMCTTPPDAVALRSAAAELSDAGLTSEAVAAHLAAGLAGTGVSATHDLRTAARLSWRQPITVRLLGHRASAEVALRSGRPAEALRQCRSGIAALSGYRAAMPSAELRALASGHGVELARLGLRSLLPGASPARVLAWLELMRAAAIGGAPGPPAVQDDHLTRLRALHAELTATRSRAEPDPPRLLTEVAAVEDAVRRESWTAPGEFDPTARVGLGALRGRLGHRLLVEYAELDGRLLAVVVGRRPVRLLDLGPVAPVEQATAMLHFALRRLAVPGLDTSRAELVGRSARTSLDRLAELLVHPLGVDPEASLVVAPVGALQLVPWGSLHQGPVAVAPSASLWAATADPPGPGAVREGVVLVAGPDLPGADDEVARLATVHPGADVLVGEDARTGPVMAALRGSALVHLSCHGTVRSDSPTFSSLQMADGPLTLHEILTAGTAPERVVLAACDSAVETTYPGDEALGFVSALLAHGSRAVVASTVLVPDLAAVPLMVALHEGLARGLSAADALHAARAGAETGSPAGFVASCAFTAFGAG